MRLKEEKHQMKQELLNEFKAMSATVQDTKLKIDKLSEKVDLNAKMTAESLQHSNSRNAVNGKMEGENHEFVKEFKQMNAKIAATESAVRVLGQKIDSLVEMIQRLHSNDNNNNNLIDVRGKNLY